MSKKRGWNVYSKTRQNIGLGLLAMIVVLLGMYAFRPSASPITPEKVAEGQAANAELKASRKAEAEAAAKLEAAKPAVAIIGDSYTAGSDEGGRGDQNWTSIVRQTLKDEGLNTRFSVNGLGGAGYTRPGTANLDFADAAKDVPSDADVVLIFGSLNDQAASPAEASSASESVYRTLKKSAPDAILVVVGPTYPNASVPASYRAVSAAVLAEAEKTADVVVDPLTESWLANPDLIGTDQIHPNDAGHAVMAKKLVPVIRDAVKDHSK